MPEVQEVFRMSTQKVRPEQGFTERQEFRQRRRTRNRKLGAYAVVAAMVVVGGLVIVSQQDGGDGRQPAGTRLLFSSIDRRLSFDPVEEFFPVDRIRLRGVTR